MLRNAIVVAALLAASGCSTAPKDLSMYGKADMDGSYLRALTITKTGDSKPGKLPSCVASTVRNDSVSLNDASGGFFGYRAGSNREAGGGSVIQYVSPDESTVVARGAAGYSSAMIARSVRYTVTIQALKEGGREYKFSGIQQAQLNTGYASNSGYSPIHVMTGGGSEEAAESLKTVADELETCIR
jgi:hypothetical protein